MTAHLGNALFWASVVIAVGFVFLDGQLEKIGLSYVVAGIIVAIGFALRYILAAGKKA